MKTPSSVHLLTLLAGVLVLVACGCARDAHSSPPPGARIDGESISFPPNAPQLGQLAVEPVESHVAGNPQLFGRLAWDEDCTVRVFTPFGGRVRRVLADLGRPVVEGTPIAELESPDFGEAQADARKAASDFEQADRNLTRLHDLFDHGAASRKDLEAAEADEARAASERDRTSSRLAAYGASADSVTGVFVLRSPVSGMVVEKNVSAGQEVRPDQMLANAPTLFAPLFVLSDPTRLWVRIDATEAELADLEPGRPFTVTSSALPGRVFEGRVEVVSPSVDPETRTLRARGTVNNSQGLLKAEMFVNVELRARDITGASVPSKAVFLHGEKHYVFVEGPPGSFTRHEVRVEEERDHHVLVSGGVSPGDRVVTDGCILLEQMLE